MFIAFLLGVTAVPVLPPTSPRRFTAFPVDKATARKCSLLFFFRLTLPFLVLSFTFPRGFDAFPRVLIVFFRVFAAAFPRIVHCLAPVFSLSCPRVVTACPLLKTMPATGGVDQGKYYQDGNKWIQKMYPGGTKSPFVLPAFLRCLFRSL